MNRRFLEVGRPSLLCLLLVIGVSAPLSSVQAAVVPIDIEGFSFEDPVNLIDAKVSGSTGTSDGALPTGWSIYNPADLDYFYGLYNPFSGGISDGTYEPPVSPATIPPEGNQILYIDVTADNQGVDGVGNPRKVGFEQMLTSTLAAGTYDLSVAVGNPQKADFDYSEFGGYGIELLAGGNVIAQDVNSTTIGEGIFNETISLSVSVEGTHALLGQALGIRVYNLNLDVVALSGVGFDNVQLSLSPVPVPAAIWLFGTALLGMTGFNLRRKRAAVNEPC